MSRPQYIDPAPFLPTKADGYERKMVFPSSSSAVLSRETARLRLENKSIEKRFDRLYEQAYAARVQLKNIEAAASRGALDGSNFAASELLKLSTRIMELLAQQPEEACMRFIPDVLACLALCHVRDKRLHAAGQRLRHALTCVNGASTQARRTVFQPIGRPAGVAPPDLKWLVTVTDDLTWLRQAEQWDQYPLDLRWLAVASGDKSVLLHRYAWQRASVDLRYLTVLTGDLDWLHVGAERWRSTPAEIRLRAVAQRNPLLLCPAAIPSAARIEEEAYAELRSEITESLPPLPFGLSPEEDLDIRLQLRLASDRPSSVYSGYVGIQREKMQRDAEGVSAPPSLTVTGDATHPSMVKTAVSPRVSPAAKLQLGVGLEKKADIVAVSPSAKIAGKLTQPAKPAVQGKKEGVSHKGEAVPQVTGKPALFVEKKQPAVPEAKGATGSPVQKKAAALIASLPSSADAKKAGITGLPRTLKSPQAMVPKVPEGKAAQDTFTAGVPPSALPKIAPAMLAKGTGEAKQLEPVTKKVGIPPLAAAVSEKGVEAGVKQKIPGPPGEKVAAQSSSPPFVSKAGFPLKKGAGIKAAEGPAAATAGERKAPTLAKVQVGAMAAGKTDGTPSAVTPAAQKPGKKAGPPVPSKVGGPPGTGPPPGKTSAPPPQTDKISAPSSPTGKLSAPSPPAGKVTAPPPPAGKVTAPPAPADKVPAPSPPTGKVSAPPPPEGKVSAPPPPAGKVSPPPAPAGKVSPPPAPAGKVSPPPAPAGKVSAPPPPAGKVSPPPAPAGKVSAPPPPAGKISAPPPPAGKVPAPPPPVDKVSAPPAPAGKVPPPPAPAGKVAAPPPPPGKTPAAPPPPGKSSAAPPPPGKSSAAPPPPGKMSEPPTITGKVSAPPPPPVKVSAPPPTPPAGKGKMAFRGEVEGGDNTTKKASSFKEPSLELHATAEDEVAKASDVVSAQKLGMPVAKKLPLAAKGAPLNAPASKMAENTHTTVGSDEASATSKLVGAEDSPGKKEPNLPQTGPVGSSQVGTGGRTLAENGELQQPKVGAKPPGKPPQVKKALGFPPKKTMPPSVPKKISAAPPT